MLIFWILKHKIFIGCLILFFFLNATKNDLQSVIGIGLGLIAKKRTKIPNNFRYLNFFTNTNNEIIFI